MMRSVGLILFVLLFNSYSFAQNTSNYLFKFYSKLGLQAGGPIYHSETIVGKKGSPGFNPIGGVGLSYDITKRFHLAMEMFLSRRKINYSSDVKEQFYIDQQTMYFGSEPITFEIETTFTGKTKGNFDLHYLELPLLLQFQLSDKLLIEAGPYYAWAYYRQNKGTASGIVGRTDIVNPHTIENREYDNSPHLNIRYWGMLAGVQYKLGTRVSADLRFTYSTTSLYDKEWKGVDYTLKDLYGQLSINYYIVK